VNREVFIHYHIENDNARDLYKRMREKAPAFTINKTIVLENHVEVRLAPTSGNNKNIDEDLCKSPFRES